MQSFSFKSDYDENRNIERIITERNRKLAKQQIIFSLLLLVLLAVLGWYIVRRFIYTEFDGYVQTEYKDYRAMEDVYLFDQYTDVGDIVIPGDTLYSFVYVNLFDLGNLSSEPSVVVNDRNARLQLNMAYADANVLRVKIRELENQIEKEDNNIRFGLTDNSHKMDLQRQLAEAREQLNATLKKAYMYGNIRHESQAAVNRFGQYSVEFANEQLGLDHSLRQLYDRKSSAIRYAIAQDTAIVTKRWAPPFSRVFKQEEILQLEDVNYETSNMQVVAYVPTQHMSRINNNTTALVIVNDDVKFTATVKLLGARTEELPVELRNSLSHTYVTVMVVFRPDPGQTLPLWAVVDRVPVKVRIRNFDNGRRDDGSDYWFITRYGLTEISKYYLGMMRSRRTSFPYRYDPDGEEHQAALKRAAEADSARRVAERAQLAEKRAERRAADAALRDSLRRDSLRRDSLRRDSLRRDSLRKDSLRRIAAAKDSAKDNKKSAVTKNTASALPPQAKPPQPKQQAQPTQTQKSKTQPTQTQQQNNQQSKPKQSDAQQPSPQPKQQAQQPKQPSPQPTAARNYVKHRVEWGETLYSIARSYGVSMESIIELNPGIDKMLYADTVIKIPVNE